MGSLYIAKMSSHEGVQSPRHQTAGHVSSMNLDGTSDSPQGSKSGSRRGSEAGGSPRKASGSTKPTPFKASEGLDPARDYNKPELTPAEIIGKRVDLPIDAYRTVSHLKCWSIIFFLCGIHQYFLSYKITSAITCSHHLIWY